MYLVTEAGGGVPLRLRAQNRGQWLCVSLGSGPRLMEPCTPAMVNARCPGGTGRIKDPDLVAGGHTKAAVVESGWKIDWAMLARERSRS